MTRKPRHRGIQWYTRDDKERRREVAPFVFHQSRQRKEK